MNKQINRGILLNIQGLYKKIQSFLKSNPTNQFISQSDNKKGIFRRIDDCYKFKTNLDLRGAL